MSLAKFANRNNHNGAKLHWGRADRDGMPFRGDQVPMYTDEEFEARTHKVKDPHVETFDLSIPEDKAKYLDVVDGIVNGWYECLFIERWRDKKHYKKVYAHIEWVEYFLEDGSKARYLSPGQMELPSGQPNGGSVAG